MLHSMSLKMIYELLSDTFRLWELDIRADVAITRFGLIPTPLYRATEPAISSQSHSLASHLGAETKPVSST